MTTNEPRIKWWEAPEADQPARYILHLALDCNIPWDEALSLTIHNFALNLPDPLDTLLAQLEDSK